MKRLARNNNQGFTLIEMLVVVIIISFLVGIVLTGTLGFQASARDTRRIGDLRNVANYLELYFNKCGHYPGGGDCSISAVSDWNGVQDSLRGAGIIAADAFLPQDPNQRSGKTYFYGVSPSDNLIYVIGTELERGNTVLDRDTDQNVYGIDCGSGTSGEGDKVYCIKSS